MMKQFFTFLLTLAITCFANAQEPLFGWVKQFGGPLSDNVSSVGVDASGNVYTTGTFRGTADFDPGPGTLNFTSIYGGGFFGYYPYMYISKLDAAGNLVWAKAMGNGGYDIFPYITVDANGSVFITGSFVGTMDMDPGPGIYNLTATGQDSDVFILKLNSSGEFQWAKKIGGSNREVSRKITLDNNGNIFVIGTFQNTADFDPGTAVYNLTALRSDAFILKLNGAGSFTWAKQFAAIGSSQSLNISSVFVDNSGNVYSTGYFLGTVDFDPEPSSYMLTTATSSNYDMYVVKLNSSGNLTWVKQMESTNLSIGYSIIADESGNVYACGYFLGTTDFDPGSNIYDLTNSIANRHEGFVLKLDDQGNFVWSKSFKGNTYAFSLGIDNSKNIYTTGSFTGTADFDPGAETSNLTANTQYVADIFVSALNNSGNHVWTGRIGGPNRDDNPDLKIDVFGNLYIAGTFEATADFDPGQNAVTLTSSGQQDIFVLKLNTSFQDVIPPSILSGPTVSNITANSAVISWTTDETSNSAVSAHNSANTQTFTPSDASLVTSHSITLTGLTPSTTYYYRVSSKDANGNGPTISDPELSFTTADLTPAGALNFDGMDDAVAINGGAGNFGSGDFTIEFKIKTTTASCYLLSKRSVCTYSEFWNLYINSNNRLVAEFDNSGNNYRTITSSHDVNDGQWHHVAVVRKSGIGYIYIDGVLSASASLPTFLSNSNSLVIGHNPCVGSGNGINRLRGELDELRLWNRALQVCELTANMNCELTLPQTNLIAYHKFNQGEAGASNTGITTSIDATPNGYNGTLSGFALTGSISNWVTGSVTGSCTAAGDEDGDGVVNSCDCDDSNNKVYPGATEICDGLDNDCDGQADEDVSASVSIIDARCTGAGNALYFDGANRYVSGSSATSIANNFTIEFWVKPNKAIAAGMTQATSGLQGISGQGYAVFSYRGGSDAGLCVSVGTNGVAVIEHSSNYIPALLVHYTPITDWTHIAIVYVNKQPSLYLNGVLVKTGLTSTRANIYGDGAFGSDLSSGYGSYVGAIDEYRVWNTPLPATALSQWYNRSLNTFHPAFAALQWYYKLDETTGTSAIDASGKNNTGTLNNPSRVQSGAPIVCVDALKLCEGNSVTMNAVVQPAGSYTYQWYKDGQLIPEATSGSYTASVDGSYSVAAIGNSGCTGTSAPVSVAPKAAINTGTYNPVCLDGPAITLSGTPGNGIWSGPGVSNGVFNPATAGSGTHTLTYSYTDPSTGCTNSATTDILVKDRPVVTINPAGPVNICTGGSATLTAGGGVSYTWSTGATTAAITVGQQGIYTVTAKGENGCSATASVTVQPPTAIKVSAQVTSNGKGPVSQKEMLFGVAGDVTATGQGSNIDPGGRTNFYSNINLSLHNSLWWTFYPIANPRHSTQPSTGNMAFSGIDPHTGIITFTSTANMIWQAASGTESISTRLRMQLQPYTGTYTGPISSGWIAPVSAGSIGLNGLGSPDYPLIDVKALGGPGTYQVWYIFETSDGTPLNTYYKTYPHTHIDPNSRFNTSITGTFYAAGPAECKDGKATVTISASGGTGPYNGIGTFEVGPGSYTYTVIDANGCVGATTVDITEIPAPTVSISPEGSTSVCVGGNKLLSATATAGSGNITRYQWLRNSQPILGAINDKYSVTEEGSYSVTVTNSNGCATTSDPVVVSAVTLPPSVTITGPEQICPGGTVTLTAPAAPQGETYQYQWHQNGEVLGPIGDATNESYIAAAAGSYYVVVTKVTQSGSCPVQSNVHTVNLYTPASVSIIGPEYVCVGSTVELKAPVAPDGKTYRYQWYTSADGGTPIPDAEGHIHTTGVGGRYYLVVTDETENSSCPIQSAEHLLTVGDVVNPIFTVAPKPDNNAPAFIRNTSSGCTYSITGQEFNAQATDNCALASLTYSLSGDTEVLNDPLNTTLEGVKLNTGTTTITWTAVDATGLRSAHEFVVTVVDNIAPTVLTQNIIVQLDGSGNASITPAQINNGSSDNCFIPTNGYSLDKTSFTCANVGVNTVIMTVTDVNGNINTGTATVTVQDNEKPTITIPAAEKLRFLAPTNHKMVEVSLGYTVTDNCMSGLTYEISVKHNEEDISIGDGNTEVDYEIVDKHKVRLRAERSGTGEGRVYTITVIARDAAGNETPAIMEVLVAHNITNPVSGKAFKIGSTISLAGTFWDKAGNKHTGNFTIDGTTTVRGSVTEPVGRKNGAVTGSYKFTTPGVYKLQMNVTDQTGVTTYANTNGELDAIVVIYDPNGGYTVGGGWFKSPAGALTKDATANGPVSFGFQTNYYKGATLPKGETQFDFKAGELEFNALNFDYLVVEKDKAKAQFRGSGKIIGGQSGISFIMTVIDGALDGTQVDKIRMKIFNKNTGEIYYDSQPGAPDDADPTTVAGEGSIIEIGGINTTAPVTASPLSREIDAENVQAAAFEVKAMPNPSAYRFKLLTQSNSVQPLTLKVMDNWGRVVEVKHGVPANGTLYLGSHYRPGVYYAELVQGGKKQVVKLIKQSE